MEYLIIGAVAVGAAFIVVIASDFIKWREDAHRRRTPYVEDAQPMLTPSNGNMSVSVVAGRGMSQQIGHGGQITIVAGPKHLEPFLPIYPGRGGK